jgi:hypothetical protein
MTHLSNQLESTLEQHMEQIYTMTNDQYKQSGELMKNYVNYKPDDEQSQQAYTEEGIRKQFIEKLSFISSNKNNPICSTHYWRQHYSKYHRNYNHRNRYIVYECKDWCGGLGDRIKGIATTFMIALLTDRVFLINWVHPAPITDILVPNAIDWEYQKDELPEGLKYFNHPMMNTYTMNTDFLNVNFEKYYLNEEAENSEDTIIVTKFNELLPLFHSPSNRNKLQQLGLWQMDEHAFLGCIVEYLFRPSTAVVSEMMQFYKKNAIQIDTPMIGIQARLGGGTIEEDVTPMFKNQKWFELCAHNLTTRIESYQKQLQVDVNPLQVQKNVPKFLVRWFITTDNDSFKENIKTKYQKRFLDLGRQIRHIDHHKDPKGQINTFVEELILQQCIELIVSRSGFGEVAADISRKKTNHFTQKRECY